MPVGMCLCECWSRAGSPASVPEESHGPLCPFQTWQQSCSPSYLASCSWSFVPNFPQKFLNFVVCGRGKTQENKVIPNFAKGLAGILEEQQSLPFLLAPAAGTQTPGLPVPWAMGAAAGSALLGKPVWGWGLLDRFPNSYQSRIWAELQNTPRNFSRVGGRGAGVGRGLGMQQGHHSVLRDSSRAAKWKK